MPSHHLVLRCPLLLLLSIFLSTRVFFNELAFHIRWPKYWSFSFGISPPNEYTGLNSFRIDWFDLLAVHRTLKSLLQHHNSKASILQHSAFFMVQLLHLYMTTGKTIALIIWTFVGKMMSLLFNTLFRSVRLSGGSMIKNPPAYAGDARDSGSITGSGRSPGGGNGSLFQYSCLKNPMDRRSLEGYSPWGRRNLDMTEWLSTY